MMIGLKTRPAGRLAEAVGWYGAAALLTAYALVSLRVVDPSSALNVFLNVSGATGIVVVSWRKHAYQPAVANIVWALVALAAASINLWRNYSTHPNMFRPDVELFRAMNNLAGRQSWLDAIFLFASEYLIFLMAGAILVAAGIVVWRERHLGWRDRLRRFLQRRSPDADSERVFVAVVRGTVAAALAYVANAIIGFIWFRPRPFVTLYDVHQLIDKSPLEKSFPSDHAAIAFAMAFAACRTWPRFGAALLAAAVLVALGRVFVGVHYPSDIVAGAAVGMFAAWLAARLERNLLRPRQ
ncbi:MAG: phosphatase PAP2 family protein [Patescibacteria group bacterium]|nr:phosphatase PAP2 family protein [Patescibacteria group bacterium]